LLALALPACLALAASAADQQGAYALIEADGGVVKAPLFSDQYDSTPVASVEDQVITLRQFSDALVSTHQHAAGKEAGTDFRPVLDRLIGVRLIALEAHEMGIDDLPEVRSAVAEYSESAARDVLKARVTRGIGADPAEVDKLYRDAVREWQMRSLLFSKQSDAELAALQLDGGKPFAEVAKAALAEKKAKGSDEVQAVSAKSKMFPQVLARLSGLFQGQSAVVAVPEGFALVQVADIRYPEDARARAEAEAFSLDHQREVALQKFYGDLVERSARIDKKLLDRVDFESKKPGFKSLLADQRPLARIEGAQPVTVAEVAEALRLGFFHGIENPIKEKRVNERKIGAFNKILSRRLLDAEARRQKIDGSPEYLRSVAEYRDSLVFGTFVDKAVLPGLRVSEQEGKQYYEQHAAEFTYPEFYALESLSFATAAQAQAAFDKLKAGTDFRWLKANAEGQVPEDKRALDFDGKTVSSTSLPPDLTKALAGARKGALRLHATQGQHLVLVVKEVVPSRVQPYPETRAAIAKTLSGEKLNQAVQDWTSKLRKAHSVKVYLVQIGI
jgi:hypothetical protein